MLSGVALTWLRSNVFGRCFSEQESALKVAERSLVRQNAALCCVEWGLSLKNAALAPSSGVPEIEHGSEM